MISAVVADGKILSRARAKTGAQHGPEEVLSKIISVIYESIEKAELKKDDISGICLAVPGPLDRDKGIMVYTPNLGFVDYPMKKNLEKVVGLPVLLENDVNAGTYGEYKQGSAKGYRHILSLFPGTGMGGAMILDGRLYRGASGNAGEMGHIIIDRSGPLCGCGNYGCLEAFSSRTGMAKEAVASASAGKSPEVYKNAGSDFKNYKSRVFAEFYHSDDTIQKIVNRGAKYLGIGMANFVNIFNPEVIVLGGGVVEKLGRIYIEKAEKSMRKYALQALSKDVTVVEAALGDDAVILGAAHILFDEAV